MVLCLVVSCIWFPCPLVSSQCLLCSSLCACLSPSVCHDFLLCASPPCFLTWPPPSSLSSTVPRLIVSVCGFSLCFPSCLCPFIASVAVMFSQSSFCLQSPSPMCFLDCEFWFSHVWFELWFLICTLPFSLQCVELFYLLLCFLVWCFSYNDLFSFMLLGFFRFQLCLIKLAFVSPNPTSGLSNSVWVHLLVFHLTVILFFINFTQLP